VRVRERSSFEHQRRCASLFTRAQDRDQLSNPDRIGEDGYEVVSVLGAWCLVHGPSWVLGPRLVLGVRSHRTMYQGPGTDNGPRPKD